MHQKTCQKHVCKDAKRTAEMDEKKKKVHRCEPGLTSFIKKTNKKKTVYIFF